MKPVVSAMNAWSCTVISGFAIIILSIIGGLFKHNDHAVMGSEENPEDGAAVASAIFTAVIVYVVFAVFCGLQGLLHIRASKRGAIALS